MSNMTDLELGKAAIGIITENEGKYSTVVADDNGAMGMGIFGFRGSNAGTLLRNIVRQGGEAAEWIRTMTRTGILWAHRPATAEEVPDLRGCITTEIGRKCQDDLALGYVNSNIKRAKNAGLSDSQAILYYCDFANQYGPGSSLLRDITGRAVQEGGTLDAMYRQTVLHTTGHLTRRKRVYERILALYPREKTETELALEWAKENELLKADPPEMTEPQITVLYRLWKRLKEMD